MPKQPAAAEANPAAALVSALNKPAPRIEDGIYIGLPAEQYHADPALGSSGLRDLLKGPNLFWHKSRMNPRRPKDKDTPAKILGTATHTLLLDGKAAFEATYVRGPYGDEDEDLTSAEKSALTKAAKAKLMKGQELLAQADYDFVLGCKEVIDNDADLRGCLDGGLAEVSIFWTRGDGVRCKARHDMLKMRAIGDLKTIANERERPLDQACLLDINTYRYDIPAEHYMEGRRQMLALLEAGRLFAGSEMAPLIGTGPAAKSRAQQETMAFLVKVCAHRLFAFQLVFIPKKGAPDAWSCVLSPGNPILDNARNDIEIAIETYKRAMKDFGPDKRWLPGHVVAELDIEMLPYSFGRVSQRR